MNYPQHLTPKYPLIIIVLFLFLITLTGTTAAQDTSRQSNSYNYAEELLHSYDMPKLAGLVDTYIPDDIDVEKIKGYRGTVKLFADADLPEFMRPSLKTALLVAGADNIVLRTFALYLTDNGQLTEKYIATIALKRGDAVRLQYVEGGSVPWGKISLKNEIGESVWITPISDGPGFMEPSVARLYYNNLN